MSVKQSNDFLTLECIEIYLKHYHRLPEQNIIHAMLKFWFHSTERMTMKTN